MAGVKRTSGDVALLLLLVCITLLQSGSTEGLTVGFYNNICPAAEATITNAVKSKFNTDKSVVPGILRMYFHDCFVRVSNHLSYTHTSMRVVHGLQAWAYFSSWGVVTSSWRTCLSMTQKVWSFRGVYCVINLNLWTLWELVIIGKVSSESLIAKSNCIITVSWDFFRDLIAQVRSNLSRFPFGNCESSYSGCVCLILSYCLNLNPVLVYDNCEDQLLG